jgi:succinoglycan biosynthesis protein ExoO
MVFGGWPALRLRAGMDVFRSIHIRGGWRIGQVMFARDPHILVSAAMAAADRLFGGPRLSSAGRGPCAPDAVAVPCMAADFLFVARHGRRDADFILADDACLTDAIPYALRPDATSAVLMRHPFSGQPAPPDEAREAALLAKAGAVIAIWNDDATLVRRHLPGRRVILAPMASVPAAAPQPGVDGRILFIGGDTASNVVGLRWFIDQVWPDIRRAIPSAGLTVAGNVARAFASENCSGVWFAGWIADLAELYRRSAVVILPLRARSGPNTRLIEALGHGKAIVVTDATVSGIEPPVRHAVCVANEPGTFATGVITLLQDKNRRLELGQAALDHARRHLAPETCYRELLKFAAARAGIDSDPE